MYSNNLKNEKSPYLLQHSHNPVDWHPWNEDTLKMAKEQDKPIFLSVGYSTCYWCHVMERESFENEKIADLLNLYFINIKVDREERPDIDRVYMTALQSMIGSGGWPMNMFLTPDLKPFYGATYIPPKAKYGRIGFEDIIEQIQKLWNTKRQDVINSSEKIFVLLNSRLSSKFKTGKNTDISFNHDVFDRSFESMKNIYDYDNGGFGIGNKFPRPVLLNYLLSLYHIYNNTEALDMVTFTLKKMCEGGIYDHLGYGFHRYSVDLYWRVPHFEKMLYDQAQISSILFDVYSITGNEYFLKFGNETLNYVLNNLKNNEFGFYSAEDAESAIEESIPGYKEEGYFYLWEKKQIDEILGKDNSSIFCYTYGIKHEGNTISDPHNIFKNKNVLYLNSDLYDTAKKFEKTPDEVKTILDNCTNILLSKRKKRPRPHLDKKVLTSWNALLISAFVKGFKITNNNIYKESAEKCCTFIIEKMWNDKNNTLYHRYIESDVRFKGTLDDYSFFAKALLDIYEITFNAFYLKNAIKISDTIIDKFYDKENSGFFDAEHNSEDIFLKTKEIYDGAEPSGNAVSIENFLRLGHITGNNDYLNLAENSIKFFYTEIQNLPFSSPYMLNNILLSMESPKEIIFTGDIETTEFNKIISYINKKFLPFKIIVRANEETESISPIINKLVSSYEKTRIYVCENFTCKLPVNNLEDLKKLI